MTLVDEGRRQLDICNACRYCEGYCAVYPALERRLHLSAGDLVQLANLCHDCRACYYACMYAPPHEFALNPPQLLSELRRQSYDDLVPLRRIAPRWRAPLVVGVVSAAVLVVVETTRGISVLWRAGSASPYRIVPYPAMLALGLCTAAAAIVLFALGAFRYGRLVGPGNPGASRLRAAARAAHHGARLTYLRSAGVECTYPRDNTSPARRRCHQLLVGGVLAALAATIAAGISQDLLSSPPPYALDSAPVVLGILGGAAMLVGAGGLWGLSEVADDAPADRASTGADAALRTALVVLALSGLLTLVLRSSAAFGVLLVVHLTAVFTCFLLAPLTKFAHSLYRYLALVHDEMERAGAHSP